MKTSRAPGVAEPMEGGNMTHLRKLGAMAVALLLGLLGITAYSQAQPVDSPAARIACPAEEHPDFITLELWGTQYTRDAEGNLQKELPKETIKYAVFKVYQDRSEQLWINPRYEASKHEYEVVNYPSTVDEWNFTFSVPRYELAGPTWTDNEVEYNITEIPTPGYRSDVDLNPDGTFRFTNTLATDVSATKAWQDDDNAKQTRPENITFVLLGDGKEVARKTVGAAEGWKATFADVDKCAEGYLINYTIVEDSVDGYTSTVTGDMTDGFVVTNSIVPPPTPTPTPTPTESETPEPTPSCSETPEPTPTPSDTPTPTATPTETPTSTVPATQPPAPSVTPTPSVPATTPPVPSQTPTPTTTPTPREQLVKTGTSMAGPALTLAGIACLGAGGVMVVRRRS